MKKVKITKQNNKNDQRKKNRKMKEKEMKGIRREIKLRKCLM